MPIQIPREIYKEFVEDMPPNPLFPKTMAKGETSPKIGGVQKFMKLVRFRGQDTGYSYFRAESAKIERINFPEGTTLRKIFLPAKPEVEGLSPKNRS